MSVNGYSTTKQQKRALKRTQPPINMRVLPAEFQAPARRMNRDQIQAMWDAIPPLTPEERLLRAIYG